MTLFCAQIDDVSKQTVCTTSLATKQGYERIGLTVAVSNESDVGACRVGEKDCPSGHTCTERFAHCKIPNANPTYCRPDR